MRSLKYPCYVSPHVLPPHVGVFTQPAVPAIYHPARHCIISTTSPLHNAFTEDAYIVASIGEATFLSFYVRYLSVGEVSSP